MYIGGLDIGTTGCKISLYNEKGESILTSYSEYASVRNNELQEINPNDVWESVKKVIYDAKDKAGKIDAIGVTSFGESFVLLDENDNILMNSMLYTDKRGAEQAKRFDKSRVIEIAGAYPNGMYSLPKVGARNFLPSQKLIWISLQNLSVQVQLQENQSLKV